jgi:DNA-binding response OmpR family regulator/REP element-mobilizing transposase RayT
MTGEVIILVISASPEISSKIQRTLDETGGYTTILSSNSSEALDFAHRTSFPICILDVLTPHEQISSLVNELRSLSTGMHLILILASNDLTYPDSAIINPDAVLPRYFTPQEFLASLVRVDAGINKANDITPPSGLILPNSYQRHSSPPQETNIPEPLSKIEDSYSLSQRLSGLSLKTSAHALIILRRKQLLAEAGVLPSAAIQELVELINSFSRISSQNLQKQIAPGHKKTENGDMVRFIQLNTTKDKYLLYAISLTKEMMLALVFDHETQFSIVRRQTWQIAHDLSSPPPTPQLKYHAPNFPVGQSQPNQYVVPPTPAAAIESIIQPPSLEPSQPRPESITAPKSGWVPEETFQPAGKQEEPPLSPVAEFPEKEIEEPLGITPPTERVETPGYHDSFELEESGVGEPMNLLESPHIQEGQTNSELKPDQSLQPISFGRYITYSCLLIPRMPQHLLTSNLATYLFKWMGQLCLAYGWRLEHLSIHSNYIQWIAGAPLTTSPAFLVRTTRQKTSQYIFTQFPPLTNDNPSGDFWAPGFFIAGGRQTINSQLIDNYINEIRNQQGVYRSNSNP